MLTSLSCYIIIIYVLWWEQLRSRLSATLKFIIKYCWLYTLLKVGYRSLYIFELSISPFNSPFICFGTLFWSVCMCIIVMSFCWIGLFIIVKYLCLLIFFLKAVLSEISIVIVVLFRLRFARHTFFHFLLSSYMCFLKI